MTFTPYTLVTTILSSVVVIVVLNLYLKQVNYEILFSPTALAVILFVPLLRMFIPIEFPFTRVIRSYVVLPAISKAMTHPLVEFSPGYGINLLHVFLLVWVSGFVCTEGRSRLRYREFVKCFNVMISEQDERDRRIIAEYFAARNLKPRKIRLIRLPGAQTSFFFSRKGPTILLPLLELTDQQLRDVLWHELSHYEHGDILKKDILCVLCSVYWWLPSVKTFRKWIDSILEIRADREVMRGRSREERDAYINMMMRVYRPSVPDTAPYFLKAAGFSAGGKGAITRRLNAIKAPQNLRRQKCLTFLFVLALVAVMAFSFGFVVQPFSRGYLDDTELFAVPESGNYLVLREDGSYDLFFNNEYVGITEEILDDFKDFPIINDKQEETP